ncbi:MAG: FIST signal transduction protein [Syntrophobacteraceae bacterium]
MGKVLKATKVDENKREVLHFNGKPAAEAYAEARGVSVEDAPKHFMHSPVGLMIGGEPYVRSPQRMQDGGMVFYCKVNEGMELSVLESTDIVDDTRKAVETKKRELGDISGILNFHCILRTLELEDKQQTESYGKIFTDIPTIGFSTYGEQYIGHINQTSTMLVIRGKS